MKKNIIFLDFDGVINDNISKVNEQSLELLLLLIKQYNISVVPISSHIRNATTNQKNKVTEYLHKLGITDIDDFIDPNFEGTFLNIKLSSRVVGIVDYLIKNPNINYIILDDEYFNQYHLLGLNYLRTNSNKGLQTKDLKKFQLKHNNHRYLSKVKYKYRDINKQSYIKYSNDLVKVLKKVYESRR